MNRRELGILFGALACAGLARGPARAQQVPVEIQDYVRLDSPAEVTLPPGKTIEVVEFFWYECPHCDAFEPMLVDWVRRLAPDVAFRTVPVGYTPRHEPAQRMFFALQTMGLAESLHGRVYHEIHQRYRRIDFEWQMVSLVSSLGGDGATFRDLLRSPQVGALARRATQLADAYEIDGVPTLGIQGRYRTSPEMAGGRARALEVTDHLIQRCRAAG